MRLPPRRAIRPTSTRTTPNPTPTAGMASDHPQGTSARIGLATWATTGRTLAEVTLRVIESKTFASGAMTGQNVVRG